MASDDRSLRARSRTLVENPTASEIITLLYGLAFLVVGVAGFFVTGFDDFAHHDTGETILGFEVNPLHNIVHILLGLLGIIAAFRITWALSYGVLVAVGYGATLVYGLFAIGEDWNFLSLNTADNWLHLVAALIGVGIAALAAYELRAERSPGRRPGSARDQAPTA